MASQLWMEEQFLDCSTTRLRNCPNVLFFSCGYCPPTALSWYADTSRVKGWRTTANDTGWLFWMEWKVSTSDILKCVRMGPPEVLLAIRSKYVTSHVVVPALKTRHHSRFFSTKYVNLFGWSSWFASLDLNWHALSRVCWREAWTSCQESADDILIFLKS